MKFYITERVFANDKPRYMNMEEGDSVILKKNATAHEREKAMSYLVTCRNRNPNKIYELELAA